jgi:hypothetical protein
MNRHFAKCATTINNSATDSDALMSLYEDKELDKNLIPEKQKSFFTKF